MPIPYEAIVYPNNTDFFQEVSDGTSPQNLILAKYINKLHNAVRAVEEVTQYSAYTPTATGSFAWIATRTHTMRSDLDDPGLRLTLDMTVDAAVAAQHFGGSPFSRQNAIFVSSVAWRISGGVRTYFRTRQAINVGREFNNTTCTINIIKPEKWRRGHVVEIQLMIVKP